MSLPPSLLCICLLTTPHDVTSKQPMPGISIWTCAENSTSRTEPISLYPCWGKKKVIHHMNLPAFPHLCCCPLSLGRCWCLQRWRPWPCRSSFHFLFHLAARVILRKCISAHVTACLKSSNSISFLLRMCQTPIRGLKGPSCGSLPPSPHLSSQSPAPPPRSQSLGPAVMPSLVLCPRSPSALPSPPCTC